MKIKKVAIVGGTYGNENRGVFLVNKLKNALPEYKGLELKYLLANPMAIKNTRRFMDHDLNRSFGIKELQNIESSEYEFNRAKVINYELGPKGDPKYDFIIDMHTTTSNMGVTFIFSALNKINLQLACFLSERNDSLNLYYHPPESKNADSDLPYLNSISPFGLPLEVGPVPNGLLRHDVIEMTEKTVRDTLEFITLLNNDSLPDFPDSLEIFQHMETILFPCDDDGNITAYIHKDLQDKDFCELKQGDPIFYTVDNKTIYFENEFPMYPVFVNEAAYYYQNIAFSLSKKISISTHLT
jgi:aspartoacylase